MVSFCSLTCSYYSFSMLGIHYVYSYELISVPS